LITDNTVLITDVKMYYHQHTHRSRQRYFSVQWKRRRSRATTGSRCEVANASPSHRVANDNVGWQCYRTILHIRLYSITSEQEVTRALRLRGQRAIKIGADRLKKHVRRQPTSS